MYSTAPHDKVQEGYIHLFRILRGHSNVRRKCASNMHFGVPGRGNSVYEYAFKRPEDVYVEYVFARVLRIRFEGGVASVSIRC